MELSSLAHYLDRCLGSHRFPDDQHGVYLPSNRSIVRLGLALEPWPGLAEWVEREQVDALFLHRPWRLIPESLAPDVGVIAYHLAFDLNLTLCYNPRLAQIVQMTDLEPFAYKDGVPLGMLGRRESLTLHEITSELEEIFRISIDIEQTASSTIEQIAVVGAMNDTLVREAASKGVELYITGQFRSSARKAVQETAMPIAVIGHRASELWGLRALASLLSERWADLNVLLAPDNH